MANKYYLNNINVFNSEDEYETNKDALNVNDISLIPFDDTDNAGVPIGFEYFTVNPNIPTGSLPLIGGTYSRTAYAALWEWVQTQTGYLISEADWQEKSTANDGNVPFYSTGDGSTTFRIPSLSCWIKGANSIEEVGSYLAAGLPNIEGQFVTSYRYYEDTTAITNWTGAMSISDETAGSSTGPGHNYSKMVKANMDASKSNDIYGSSDTVQPKSIAGLWLVKAFGTVTNTKNQDLQDISNAFSQIVTIKVWDE